MSTTYPISSLPKASVSDIVEGTRDDAYVTPKGLKDAGFGPLPPPANAVVFTLSGTDVPDTITLSSSTGFYTVNGVLSGYPVIGQNVVTPSDSGGVTDPSGYITQFNINHTGAPIDTAYSVTQLPEGLDSLLMSDTSGPVSIDCPLPDSLTQLSVYGAPNFTTVPDPLPPALLSFTVYGANVSLLPSIPPSLGDYFSASGCNLSEAELNDAMIDLGATTGTGAKLADISGNPGSATCDTSPATANGWTVTV